MREIRTLRATWRGLETWNGRITTAAGAPVLDPTCEGLEVKFGRVPALGVAAVGKWPGGATVQSLAPAGHLSTASAPQ
jgi:hypothetical protein